MIRFMRAALVLSAFFLAAIPILPAAAQQNPGYAKVVSACGTLPAGVTYSVGVSYPITMDPTGHICDSGSGGGGAVTASQGNAGSTAQAWFFQPTMGGAVVSAGNPLFSQITAGSAIIGKVDIDQATPGTTNGVVLNSYGAGALNTGTPTQTSVSCGTGSTTLLAAAAATKFISVKVPSAAANVVWFNWAGVAAVTAPPSEDVGIGAKITWSSGQNGFLPTSQINCIASSATTVTVEYQ